MPSYKLSRAAQNDLAAIAEYTTRTFGSDQTIAYRDGLIQTLNFLAEFPLVARERSELKRPSRAYRYEAHLIFYRLDGKGIFIQRIRHGQEDWSNDQ